MFFDLTINLNQCNLGRLKGTQERWIYCTVCAQRIKSVNILHTKKYLYAQKYFPPESVVVLLCLTGYWKMCQPLGTRLAIALAR